MGPLELAVLLAVAHDGEAYGLAVRREVSRRLQHDYSVGAVYTTLERLERKGLVRSRISEPLPVRGGRSRRLFRVTRAGERALRDAQRTAQSLWAGRGIMIRPQPI